MLHYLRNGTVAIEQYVCAATANNVGTGFGLMSFGFGRLGVFEINSLLLLPPPIKYITHFINVIAASSRRGSRVL